MCPDRLVEVDMETKTESEMEMGQKRRRRWRQRWRQRWRCGGVGMWGYGAVGDRRRVVELWGSWGRLDSAAEGLCQAWHCVMWVHLTKLEPVILDSFSVCLTCIVHC